jgi:trans-aconitate methyltransferase
MNDPTIINDLSWQHRAARALQVANELKIFGTVADRALSVQEISKACGTKPELTEKLLIVCTAMGLLKKHAGRYKNTRFAKTYLLPDSRLYQGNIIAHCAAMWDFWHNLPQEIRLRGASCRKAVEQHRTFILAMRDLAVAGRAQLVADNIDLTGRARLFDVGGGPGSYSIALCRRYPGLRAIVFDTPETIVIARELIAAEKVQDRITTRAGDWDADAFGQANNVVLLSNVFHGHDSRAEMKLKKAYDSMVNGGLLVVQDFLLNDRKTGPLIPAIFNLMRGAFSRSELTGLIKRAGFTRIRLVLESAEYGCSLITAEKTLTPARWGLTEKRLG